MKVSDYTDKEYGVCLEWAYFTQGRAKLFLKYIEDALSHTYTLEVWHVWLDGGFYEYDERPVIKRETLHIDEVVPKDIRELMILRFGIMPVLLDQYIIVWKYQSDKE